MAFDGGDYRLDFCNGVARVVVFFAARAAAVFVVDLAESLRVTAKVHVLIWFGSLLWCRHGLWCHIRVR